MVEKLCTDEVAAEIAAKKWCDMLFGDHIQNIGDDDFCCMLGMLSTMLANQGKKKISEELKTKSYENIKKYYMKYLEHKSSTSEWGSNYSDWVSDTFPAPEENIKCYSMYKKEVKYFDRDLYCDYHPCPLLFHILYNSGLEPNLIESICPIKTGIEINPEDNSVILKTYRHREVLNTQP